MVHYAGIVRPNRAAGGLNFRFDQIIWVAWRRQRFMRVHLRLCAVSVSHSKNGRSTDFTTYVANDEPNLISNSGAHG